MLKIIAIAMILTITGCSSVHYAGWPVKKMQDPVTEEKPDVIRD